ncbi:MAG TPA: hypothetical protein PLV25_07330, partial [Opitutales bacterium]|nr:hypothetical protein [Opitutales bacterium]
AITVGMYTNQFQPVESVCQRLGIPESDYIETFEQATQTFGESLTQFEGFMQEKNIEPIKDMMHALRSFGLNLGYQGLLDTCNKITEELQSNAGTTTLEQNHKHLKIIHRIMKRKLRELKGEDPNLELDEEPIEETQDTANELNETEQPNADQPADQPQAASTEQEVAPSEDLTEAKA